MEPPSVLLQSDRKTTQDLFIKNVEEGPSTVKDEKNSILHSEKLIKIKNPTQQKKTFLIAEIDLRKPTSSILLSLPLRMLVEQQESSSRTTGVRNAPLQGKNKKFSSTKLLLEEGNRHISPKTEDASIKTPLNYIPDDKQKQEEHKDWPLSEFKVLRSGTTYNPADPPPPKKLNCDYCNVTFRSRNRFDYHNARTHSRYQLFF